jgi:hypothetical protein
MKKLSLFSMRIVLANCLSLLIFIIVTSLPAYAMDLKANFRLFGEVSRFGIGYGDMALRFGVNGPVAEIGKFGFIPGGASFATGVLEGLSLPKYGFRVVDIEFSVPFSLDIDQAASMYIGLGDNGMNSFRSGSIQVIFDFSDDIYFRGSLLGVTPDQGLMLTSVTLEDGTPLQDVGLQFEFVPENTVLRAGASAVDCGVYPRVDTASPLIFPYRAEVLIPKARATAKLRGGPDGRNPVTDALVDLDVNPEPDPYVFDLAFATVSGSNNVKLTRISPTTNNPPIANAGENLTITSEEQCGTIIQGEASDADNDPLLYRWVEGETELFTWHPVGPEGEAPFDLCAVPLGLGEHILTLEVTDDQATSTDSMSLSIDNSPPYVAPTGGGTYELGTLVSVGGEVLDFDGDMLNYHWSEGATNYCSGEIQSIEGGVPVILPYCELPPLELGAHTLTLTVSDGINAPVSRNIIIDIVDTTEPTLAPVSSKLILWPPNHDMVDIEIDTNAWDNSGMPILSATVASNEPIDGLGDSANPAPDWTSPVIDQETGVVTLQLRAERSGRGDGRIYTVAIIAIDPSGNASTANVEIIVPYGYWNFELYNKIQ